MAYEVTGTMREIWNDLRYSFRLLVRSPLVTGAAVLSLALGIGANAAVFSLVRGLLLEPVPVPEPERLVAVFTHQRGEAAGPFGDRLPMSHPNFEDLRDGVEGGGLSHLAAALLLPVALVSDGADAEQVPAHLVSHRYFEALGVRAHRGRLFADDETSVDGAAPVTVLGHRLWQRRFAGDPDVVGRSVRINGQPFRVIGIADPGFSGTNILAPELWLPMTMHEQVLTGIFRDFFPNRRALMLEVVGRLQPGVGREAAAAELAAVAARLEREYPEANQGRGVAVMPLLEAAVPPDLRPLFVRAGAVLLGASALVLLIACANVANLLLARALGRRSETALRLSLGSGRARVIRQLVVEGMLLALAGGAAGLLLGLWAQRVLWSLRPPQLLLAAPDLRFDSATWVGGLVLALALGALFALAPALRASRPDLIREVAGRTRPPESHRPWALRNLLVVFQVALSMVALVVSGLFFASLRNLSAVDPGFDVDRVATLTFNLGAQGLGPEQALGFANRAVEAAAAVPGVTSAALATNLPLGPFPGVVRTLIPAGRDAADPAAGMPVTVDQVSPELHATLGIPLVAGRALTSADRADSTQVAVINEELARRLAPGGSAVGMLFTFAGDDRPREVVGVARGHRTTATGDAGSYVFVPLEQMGADFLRLFVRTDGDPAAALAGVQRRVRELDPALPLVEVQTLAKVAADAAWAPRLGALMLGGFGALALLLASVGLYGVLSHSVQRRRRELGVRMAIGAARGDLVRLVVRQGMTLVVAGMVIGLAAAALAGRWAEGLLHGVGGLDPLAFAAAAALLAAVALVASFLPARRAGGVDPVVSLRPD